MIAYDRYTELLGKIIHKTISPAEQQAVGEFETAHRKPELKLCPKCKGSVWTFLTPYQVAHDIANCQGKSATKS